MNRKFKNLFVFLFFSTGALAHADSNSWIPEFKISGVESLYSNKMKKLAVNWAKGESKFCTSKDPVKFPDKMGELKVTPHFTEDNDLYLGFSGKMKVNAGIDSVVAAVMDSKQAKAVHYDYEEVNTKALDKNLIEMERVKFISFLNIRTPHTIFLEVIKNKNRAIILWRLKEKTSLVASDGAILLAEDQPGVTQYCQANFYTADFGPVGIFRKEIWKKSYRGTFREVYSFRLRAERPKLSSGDHKNAVEALIPKEVTYSDHIAPQVKPLPFK